MLRTIWIAYCGARHDTLISSSAGAGCASGYGAINARCKINTYVGTASDRVFVVRFIPQARCVVTRVEYNGLKHAILIGPHRG